MDCWPEANPPGLADPNKRLGEVEETTWGECVTCAGRRNGCGGLRTGGADGRPIPMTLLRRSCAVIPLGATLGGLVDCLCAGAMPPLAVCGGESLDEGVMGLMGLIRAWALKWGVETSLVTPSVGKGSDALW